MQFLARFPLTKTCVAALAAAASALAFLASGIGDGQLPHFPIDLVWIKRAINAVVWAFALVPFVAGYEYLPTLRRLTLAARRRYHLCIADKSDYRAIVELGKSMIGDRQPSVKFLSELAAVNSQIVIAIYEDASKARLMGFFILYPLKSAAIRRLLSGRIPRASALKPADIHRSFRSASGIYVAMVGGTAGHAKGFTLAELLQTLATLQQHGKLKMVFSRPASQPGARVMSKYGFQRLPEPSEISVKYVTPASPDEIRLKRHLAETLR